MSKWTECLKSRRFSQHDWGFVFQSDSTNQLQQSQKRGWKRISCQIEHLLKCVGVDPHLVRFLLSKLLFNPDYHYINVSFEQSLSTSIRSDIWAKPFHFHQEWNQSISLEICARLKDSVRGLRATSYYLKPKQWVIFSSKWADVSDCRRELININSTSCRENQRRYVKEITFNSALGSSFKLSSLYPDRLQSQSS